jgi:hypothetical protein
LTQHSNQKSIFASCILENIPDQELIARKLLRNTRRGQHKKAGILTEPVAGREKHLERENQIKKKLIFEYQWSGNNDQYICFSRISKVS